MVSFLVVEAWEQKSVFLKDFKEFNDVGVVSKRETTLEKQNICMDALYGS